MYHEHECDYKCRRLKCIERQRDELRELMGQKVAEAVAAEREECARVCEKTGAMYNNQRNRELGLGDLFQEVAEGCAAAVRERGAQ